MTALGKPDPARELAEVLEEMARLREEHWQVTGKSDLHIDRCQRRDLHERLVTLHMRKKVLEQGINRSATEPRRI